MTGPDEARDAEVVNLRPDQPKLMLEVELPDGHHVTLRDPYKVSERERRPLKAQRLRFSLSFNGPAKPAGSEATLSGHPFLHSSAPPVPAESDEEIDAKVEALAVWTTQILVFFIEAWDYDEPVSADAVESLPAHVYVVLDAATTEPYRALFPELTGGPTTP